MLIAVDHGNSLIKTVHHQPFTSGLQESDAPPYGGETLRYQGKYYTLSVCESLEHGVITLYNQIKSKVNAELDALLEESEIDAILSGRTEHVPPQVPAAAAPRSPALSPFSALSENKSCEDRTVWV